MTTTQRFTLAAAGIGLFMIFLDAMIVNVALPAIQSSFGVGEAGLQWVVTAYSLGMAVAIMSSATAADLHGRRKIYLISVVLFTLSSAACGFAPTLFALNAARLVQGVAAAAINVASLALVSAAFPEAKQKARAIGIWTAIACSATAVGPTLGGLLVEEAGWRSIFLVNVPIGLTVLVLTLRYVEESRDQLPRHFDLTGQLLFVAAVGALSCAVIEGPHQGWLSVPILVLFVVAAGALVAFIRYERGAPDPMMDLALFRDRTYSLAIGTIVVVFFSMYGMLLVTTQYLQNVRGLSPAAAGLMLLPYSAAVTIVSLVAGRLVAKVGTRLPILAGLGLIITGFATLALGMQGSSLVVNAGLVLAATGVALCLTPITSLAMSTVPPERAGMASGIMSAQRAIGSTVGFAVMGSILAAWIAATLDVDLVTAIPDPVQRKAVVAEVVANANPRAYASMIGPGRPIRHAEPATQAAILTAADADFVQGIRASLGTALVLLLAALAAGFAWFPRGKQAIADAQTEAATLAREETEHAQL